LPGFSVGGCIPNSAVFCSIHDVFHLRRAIITCFVSNSAIYKNTNYEKRVRDGMG
jgi:hypothetical protein